MNHLMEIQNGLKLAVRSQANVLLTGATGTGKSCLAKTIHDSGSRAPFPFVVINLATLHEGTFESELFGHERGAFTGADQVRRGKLSFAERGTVFLDEIGELSFKAQTRLLEFLQSRKVSPIGGNREFTLDVRVIAATNRCLSTMVKEKKFREDLYHRLRVLEICLPPLRQRDVEFDHILSQCLSRYPLPDGKQREIAPALLRRLRSYSWPGNIRELGNVVEYLTIASEGPTLDLAHLPPWFDSSGSAPKPPQNLKNHLKWVEKEEIRRVLTKNRGRINQTAREIGINKTTLIRRVKLYDIDI